MKQKYIDNSIILNNIKIPIITKSTSFPTIKKRKNSYRYNLMLKIHLKSGVNYLCITEQEYFCKYLGSGVAWKNLLKSSPSYIYTYLLFSSNDEIEFTRKSLEYSIFYNVVDSKNFANLIHEDGKNNNNLKKWIQNQEFETLSKIQKNNKINHPTDQKYFIQNNLYKYKERTGYDNPMHDPNIKEIVLNKSKETIKRKYGVDHAFHIDKEENINKVKQTNLLKYGVEFIRQNKDRNKEIKLKADETIQKRYGVKFITQDQTINKKMKEGLSKFYSNGENKNYKCIYCEFVGYKQHLTSHIKRCKLNPNREIIKKDYECEYCNKMFTKSGYSQHFKKCIKNPNKEKTKTIICNICNKEIGIRGYKSHLTIHNKDNKNNGN